jgi:hypothetical protein
MRYKKINVSTRWKEIPADYRVGKLHPSAPLAVASGFETLAGVSLG